MTIGSSRYKVTIQRLTTGRDEIGQPLTTWNDVAEVWADLRYLRGLEAVKAGAQAATSQVSIRLRAFFTDISTADRVVNEGVTYSIVAVLPDMQRRRYVDLQCAVNA